MIRFLLLMGSVSLALSASPSRAQTANPQVKIKSWVNERFRAIALSCGVKDENGKNYVPESVGRAFEDIWDLDAEIKTIDSSESLFFTVFQGVTPVGSQIGTSWDKPKAPIIYKFQSNSTVEQNCATLLSASGNADLKLKFVVGNVTAALKASMENNDALSAFFYRGTMISPIAVALGDGRATPPPQDLSPFAIKAHIWNWYRNEASSNPAVLQQGKAGSLKIYKDFFAVSSYFTGGLTQKRLLQGTAAADVSTLLVSAEVKPTYEKTSFKNLEYQNFQIVRWSQANMLVLPSAEAIASALRAVATKEIELVDKPDEIDPVETAPDFDISWLVRNLPYSVCVGPTWIPTSDVPPGAAQLISLQSAYISDNGCKLTGTYQPPATPENQVRISLRAKAVMPSGAPSEAFVLAGPERLIRDWRSVTNVDIEGDHSITLAPSGQATNLSLSYAVRETEPSRQVTGVAWLSTPSVKCPTGQLLPLGSPAISISRTSGMPGLLSFTFSLPGSFAADQQPAGSETQPVRCQFKGRVRLTITGLTSGMQADLDRGLLVSLPAEPITRPLVP